MNRREKLLATIVGGVVVVILVGFGLRSVIVKPMREMDRKTADVREKIEKIKQERRSFFAAEDRLKGRNLRAFADTVDQASAKSGEVLTRQIIASGLEEADFTRLPVGPRKLRGGNEIGWSVQGDGPLSNVVNLVYLMQETPWLHQVDGLSLSTGDGPGMVKVRFRYLTLVLDPAPEVERKELPTKASLDSPVRHLLDSLVARDLLRPYIKRPPPPPVPAVPGSSGSRPNPGLVPPGPESFRIVSLSEWQGEPEVHVRDLVNQKTFRYKPGDTLAGATVLMVDYRPMVMPGTSGLQSHSRVILQIGGELWAVERGKTLAEKRKLEAKDFPASVPVAK